MGATQQCNVTSPSGNLEHRYDHNVHADIEDSHMINTKRRGADLITLGQSAVLIEDFEN